MKMSREGRRVEQEDQLQPMSSFDDRVKKMVANPRRTIDKNDRRVIVDSQRSQSQSNPRPAKVKKPQALADKKPKLPPGPVPRTHNDMAQTSRDVKELLVQNEAFKDVDQEQISKLLTMLQNERNREAIAKVKKQSPKVTKENPSKISPGPSPSPMPSKERREGSKGDQSSKANVAQSPRNQKDKKELLTADQATLKEKKKLRP